jgi:hypothetical protein
MRPSCRSRLFYIRMSDLSLPLLRISIVIAMILGAFAGRASQLQFSSSAVSIAATPEPDLYLIADYSKILLFDKYHSSITRMAIVGATRRNVRPDSLMTAGEIGCLLRCDRPGGRRLHRGGNNFEGKWSNEPPSGGGWSCGSAFGW